MRQALSAASASTPPQSALWCFCDMQRPGAPAQPALCQWDLSLSNGPTAKEFLLDLSLTIALINEIVKHRMQSKSNPGPTQITHIGPVLSQTRHKVHLCQPGGHWAGAGSCANPLKPRRLQISCSCAGQVQPVQELGEEGGSGRDETGKGKGTPMGRG